MKPKSRQRRKGIPRVGQVVSVGHGKPKGYSLLTRHGTLWRSTKGKEVKGVVKDIQRNKFYQTQEKIAWVKVKLINKKGRYQHAQLYYDQKTGRRIA